MIGYSTLSNLFTNILKTKFVTGVFHSAMMKPIEGGGMKPAVPVEGRYKYIGPDDTKGFSCYCRQTGAAEVDSTEKIGSCNKKVYTMRIPHIIVFFHEEEKRDHELIISQMIKAVIGTNDVKLQKIINIPEEILRSEAPTGRFKFKANTLYFAIQIFVLLKLQTDNCEVEIKCEGVPNPYCLPAQ